jgi:S-adenosylmethionine synthetase
VSRASYLFNRPIYARTSAYGHFGRLPEPDGGFSRERTDLVDELRRTAK